MPLKGKLFYLVTGLGTQECGAVSSLTTTAEAAAQSFAPHTAHQTAASPAQCSLHLCRRVPLLQGCSAERGICKVHPWPLAMDPNTVRSWAQSYVEPRMGYLPIFIHSLFICEIIYLFRGYLLVLEL